jgi:EcsC protein family
VSTATGTKRSRLTPYEAEQVERIAAWKARPPHPLSELWKRTALPVARAVEKLIPDAVVRVAIKKAYDATDWLAAREEIRRRAGVEELAELKRGPLERCVKLATEIGARSEVVAAVEGAATGAGGMITTLLDVPILFCLALGIIRKIGHCYGYPLEGSRDRDFVLGVLLAALAGTPEVRRARIDQLHEIEDMLIVETQEDVIAEEAVSVLFQLEIFEGIPGVGVLSGAALNALFMRRVEETARFAFEERWLRDNGKVERIRPAEAPGRHLAGGWSGALGRAAYAGCYGLGFGVALPFYAASALLRPADNAFFRGLRDGAAAATERADRLVSWTHGKELPSADGREAAPGLALA